MGGSGRGWVEDWWRGFALCGLNGMAAVLGRLAVAMYDFADIFVIADIADIAAIDMASMHTVCMHDAEDTAQTKWKRRL